MTGFAGLDELIKKAMGGVGSTGAMSAAPSMGGAADWATTVTPEGGMTGAVNMGGLPQAVGDNMRKLVDNGSIGKMVDSAFAPSPTPRPSAPPPMQGGAQQAAMGQAGMAALMPRRSIGSGMPGSEQSTPFLPMPQPGARPGQQPGRRLWG